MKDNNNKTLAITIMVLMKIKAIIAKIFRHKEIIMNLTISFDNGLVDFTGWNSSNSIKSLETLNFDLLTWFPDWISIELGA